MADPGPVFCINRTFRNRSAADGLASSIPTASEAFSALLQVSQVKRKISAHLTVCVDKSINFLRKGIELVRILLWTKLFAELLGEGLSDVLRDLPRTVGSYSS